MLLEENEKDDDFCEDDFCIDCGHASDSGNCFTCKMD